MVLFFWGEMSIHSAIVSQVGLDLQNGFDLLKGKLTDGFGLPGVLQNGFDFLLKQCKKHLNNIWELYTMILTIFLDRATDGLGLSKMVLIFC